MVKAQTSSGESVMTSQSASSATPAFVAQPSSPTGSNDSASNSAGFTSSKKLVRKTPLGYIIGGLVLLLLVAGVIVGFVLSGNNQDVRQQASDDICATMDPSQPGATYCDSGATCADGFSFGAGCYYGTCEARNAEGCATHGGISGGGSSGGGGGSSGGGGGSGSGGSCQVTFCQGGSGAIFAFEDCPNQFCADGLAGGCAEAAVNLGCYKTSEACTNDEECRDKYGESSLCIRYNEGDPIAGGYCSGGDNVFCEEWVRFDCPNVFDGSDCKQNRTVVGSKSDFIVPYCGSQQIDCNRGNAPFVGKIDRSGCNETTPTPPASNPPGSNPPVSNPPHASVAPSPSPTPTPPAPICISSSIWDATTRQPISGTPKIGSQLSIQCGIVPNAASYRFRYLHMVNGDVNVVNLAATSQIAQGNFSEPFTVNMPGTYITQCSPCSEAGGKNCQAYEDPKKYALSKGLVVIDANGNAKDLPGGVQDNTDTGNGTDTGLGEGTDTEPDIAQAQLWNVATRQKVDSVTVGQAASIRCNVSANSYRFRVIEPDRNIITLGSDSAVSSGQFSQRATVRKVGLHVGQCAPCSDENGQTCSNFDDPTAYVQPNTTTSGAAGRTVWWFSQASLGGN